MAFASAIAGAAGGMGHLANGTMSREQSLSLAQQQGNSWTPALGLADYRHPQFWHNQGAMSPPQEILNQLKPPEKKMGMMRSYLDKHKDFVFTLGVIVLADHFILAGALRHRIQRLVEAVLSRLEASLGLPPEKVLNEPAK